MPLLNQQRASSATTPQEFAAEERRLLLKVARAAIEAFLHNQDPKLKMPAGHLAEPRGVFTTLMRNGELRGCVGQPFANEPLMAAVAATAISAASHDPRFPALRLPELPAVTISLSVLSPLFRIAPEEIEIGRHGLLISSGPRRGLLLPEVPVHFSWSRETFLAQTCQKAGLAPDAWRRGASIEAFSTEAFSEEA